MVAIERRADRNVGRVRPKAMGSVMMGSRGTRGGSEHDALSKARRYFNWGPGTVKALKRSFHHRQRIQPVSLDMYDARSGGWLHEAENEVAP